MGRKQEDPEVSCRVLADYLRRERDQHKQVLLVDDFVWKARDLRQLVRFYFEGQALRCFVPPTIAARFEHGEPPMKKKADVAIVTVKKPELLAAKLAFGIGDTDWENDNLNGLRCWKAVVQTGRNQDDLEVLVTMVGEEGNVSCAAACGRLFSAYDVGLSILTGIAAGVEKKVGLGDVVAANIVLDYEGARLEPGGPARRPKQFGLDVKIGRDLEFFEPQKFGWHEQFERLFTRLKELGQLTPTPTTGWKPTFHSGVVLAGEKLIADGSLDEMRKEFHDRIRAAEMEGAGFARLCEEHDIPFLVFRGICDFGTPEKDDLWQATSALAAATAARVFLEKGYRKPQTIRNR
jgi:nucleoside phosphorylase